MIRQGNELLLGTADNQVLKYESTQGYRGYFESQSLSQVYDLCDVGLGQDIVAIGGKSNEVDCLEIINTHSNTILIKLTF
jgi:hypothetical protein